MISAAGLMSLIFRTLSSPAGNPIASNCPLVSGVGTTALNRGVPCPESFERCWRLGRSLTPEAAVDLALGESDVAHQDGGQM